MVNLVAFLTRIETKSCPPRRAWQGWETEELFFAFEEYQTEINSILGLPKLKDCKSSKWFDQLLANPAKMVIFVESAIKKQKQLWSTISEFPVSACIFGDWDVGMLTESPPDKLPPAAYKNGNKSYYLPQIFATSCVQTLALKAETEAERIVSEMVKSFANKNQHLKVNKLCAYKCFAFVNRDNWPQLIRSLPSEQPMCAGASLQLISQTTEGGCFTQNELRNCLKDGASSCVLAIPDSELLGARTFALTTDHKEDFECLIAYSGQATVEQMAIFSGAFYSHLNYGVPIFDAVAQAIGEMTDKDLLAAKVSLGND